MSQPGATVERSVPELVDAADLESEVRAYSRSWPTVFAHADGARIYASDGRPYLDFFMGAGALNYGHNNPVLREALIEYLQDGGVVHSLDMLTASKAAFLEALRDLVLVPRGLDYKVQFTGPTGTNCVEAALKLARKVTGRSSVAAFTRAFHGVSLGSLAVTASGGNRAGAGVSLDHVLRLPFEGFGRHGVSGLDLLEDLVDDASSGVELPAAVIVETVQGEGGVNVASTGWLQRLAELCASRDILLIVDEVQTGCGRTGPFFGFERAGILPDVVCLSKSIGGFGLPMALTLFKRELDVWSPGEHNGTFRGFNPAHVTAAAALRTYWSDDRLPVGTAEKGELVASSLDDLCERHASLGVTFRGSGLMWGLVFDNPAIAARVGPAAFERGLLVETVGSRDEVVKLLPSLLITPEELTEGLQILDDAIAEAAAAAA
jgi:diaminobutyrate-2-oxoglutarate transaminase